MGYGLPVARADGALSWIAEEFAPAAEPPLHAWSYGQNRRRATVISNSGGASVDLANKLLANNRFGVWPQRQLAVQPRAK